MKYNVICGGILKRNGELALFGTELDEGELDDPEMRVKEGYVKSIPGSDKPAPAAKVDDTLPPPTEPDTSAQQALIDAAVKKALEDKQAQDDADKLAADQKAIDDAAAAQKAIDDQKALDDANNTDLLNKAKNQVK